MLLTKLEIEEMTGYSFKQLNVELTLQRGSVDLYDVDRDDLQMLFERVRDLAYESGQNNIIECTGY